MRNRRWMAFGMMALVWMGMMVLDGCTKRHPADSGAATTTAGQAVEQSANQESIRCVITRLKEEENEIGLTDVSNDWNYTLSYDVYTKWKSRYDETIAVSQLEVGQIVEASFDEEKKKLKSLKISYDAWEYEDVKGLTYNLTDKEITIMGKTYHYTSGLVLHDATPAASLNDEESLKEEKQNEDSEKSKNREESEDNEKLENSRKSDEEKTEDEEDEVQEADTDNNLELTGISKYDVVTCRGYKGKIYSVTVKSGHGYVRLSDYSTYIGGMVAIGEVIAPVTKDMVLTVPVGEWTLEIDKDGNAGTKKIVVNQNQEQTVNLGDLTIVSSQKGIFHFQTTPANASITIDDVEYNGRTDFMLNYGSHKVVVSAVGYKSYNGTITLSVPYMNINVDLVTLDSDEDSAAEMNTTPNKTSNTTQNQQETTNAAATTKKHTADPPVSPSKPVLKTTTESQESTEIPEITQITPTTQQTVTITQPQL